MSLRECDGYVIEMKVRRLFGLSLYWSGWAILHAADVSISHHPSLHLSLKAPPATTQAVMRTPSLLPPVRWQVLTNVALGSASSVEIPLDTGGALTAFYRVFTVPEGLVWIPPGTFTMGSPTNEAERDTDSIDQVPREFQHVVTFTRGFWMRRYEVTQSLYTEIMRFNQSEFPSPEHPVESVSWYQAVTFCNRLTQAERASGQLPSGFAYRLPTESEWEYACRAGTTSAFHYGPALLAGMTRFNTAQEYDERRGTRFGAPDPLPMGPVNVGSYQPNAFGLHDMHGNVAEWCLDGYADYPTGPVVDPVPAPNLGQVLVRGGAWDAGGRIARSARRYGGIPDHRHYAIGFRIVLVPES